MVKKKQLSSFSSYLKFEKTDTDVIAAIMADPQLKALEAIFYDRYLGH